MINANIIGAISFPITCLLLHIFRIELTYFDIKITRLTTVISCIIGIFFAIYLDADRGSILFFSCVPGSFLSYYISRYLTKKFDANEDEYVFTIMDKYFTAGNFFVGILLMIFPFIPFVEHLMEGNSGLYLLPMKVIYVLLGASFVLLNKYTCLKILKIGKRNDLHK